MPVHHVPVMTEPVSRFLITRMDGLYVDATLGLGGHTLDLLGKTGSGSRFIGIERDPRALETARERLGGYGDRVTFVKGNFKDAGTLLDRRECDGFLLDLGMSSMQIADENRGFSYMNDGPLDMAMGPGARSVKDLLEKAEAREIAGILRRFGEEPRSGAVARSIVRARGEKKITTTGELRSAVERAVPSRGSIGSLSRVFQALRIWANDELENLREFLPQAVEMLRPGGRVVVMSYHSLEDRIVKEFFRKEEKGCICPPDLPQCACGRKPTLRRLTRRPVTPDEDEKRDNPRSRSAKLRAAERL